MCTSLAAGNAVEIVCSAPAVRRNHECCAPCPGGRPLVGHVRRALALDPRAHARPLPLRRHEVAQLRRHLVAVAHNRINIIARLASAMLKLSNSERPPSEMNADAAPLLISPPPPSPRETAAAPGACRRTFDRSLLRGLVVSNILRWSGQRLVGAAPVHHPCDRLLSPRGVDPRNRHARRAGATDRPPGADAFRRRVRAGEGSGGRRSRGAVSRHGGVERAMARIPATRWPRRAFM